MGRKRENGRGEGWLMAVLLCVVFLLSLGIVWSRQPRMEIVAPAHAVFRSLEQPGLDLNAASMEELTRLPGIGEVLAERILAYRGENGPFDSAQDLLNVPGIGEGKLEKIRDMVFAE